LRFAICVPVCLAALVAALGLASMRALATEPDLATYCARTRDDDTVRRPPLAMQAALQRAHAQLLGGSPPDGISLQANGNVWCMDGKLLVCFVGANLPCGKISIARDNPGATEWCQANPGSPIPAAAIGHNSLYSYRCDGSRARITGANWALDRRGFAAKLWVPLN
jgi:hypothetical protein